MTECIKAVDTELPTFTDAVDIHPVERMLHGQDLYCMVEKVRLSSHCIYEVESVVARRCHAPNMFGTVDMEKVSR